jgi:hypothetical protein
MSPRRALIPLLATLVLALGAAPAGAAWFPSEAIDGPGDIVRLGGVDVARDGSGAAVYIKREGGVPHVFVTRLLGGTWQAPERVDSGITDAASSAVVAAGDGNRLMVLWAAGGRLYGSHFPGGSPGALSPPVQVFNGGGAELDGLDADMGINGTAYGVWRSPTGAGGADVNAVRLQASAFEVLPAPVDIDPSRPAGDGAGRPRVAVSAEGNAVATWGETAADGRRRVYGRRLTGLNLSQYPQEISLPSLNDIAGGNADSPEISIEYDGSYAWVAFRQDFGGVSRTLARRLVGSLYEAPAVLDLGNGGHAPSVAITGKGGGLAAAATGGGVVAASLLENDAFTAPVAVGRGAESAFPAVAADERNDIAVAWLRGDGGIGARYKQVEKPMEAEASLATPGLGAAGAADFAISGSRLGDFAVPILQGPAGARTLAVAVFDRPPGKPSGTSTVYQRSAQPRLRWRPGIELWGPLHYTVLVDGVAVGTTAAATQLAVPTPIAEGRHRWMVVATDRRGQQAASKERSLRIDTTRPRVRLRVSGSRRSGQTLRISVRGSDRRGSGVRSVRVSYGDRSRSTRRASSTHRYRAGRYTLRVRVADKAGNVGRRSVRLRIR